MKHYNIPIFISHYGCPHDCIFCNQKKINGISVTITKNDIKNIIEEHLKTLPKDSMKEVAFFGGTFTGIPIEKQIEFLDVVQKYVDEEKINGIRMSTRPDYINENILKILKRYSINVIELGVQSFDEEVLKKNERFYNKEIIYKASDLIKKNNILLGLQMMPGLYGSNFKSDFDAIKEIIKIKPKFLRVYPTLVIKDTKLNLLYEEKKYNPLTIEEAVKISVYYIAYMELNDINIIKMGLQPSDDLREDGVVKAGPFHSAFRELAEGEIYFKALRYILEKDIKINEKILNLKINEKSVSKIKGINKINEKKLDKKFKINIDKSIRTGDFVLDEKNYYSRKDILYKIISECE